MLDYDNLIGTAEMELADAYSNLKSTARWASNDQRFQLFKYELMDVRDGE